MRAPAPSWADRFLVAETLCLLGVARLAVVLLPGRAVLSRLGQPQTETPHDDDPSAQVLARRVQWALGAASHRAPWRCMCLEQAIAARMMLRSRGLATTVYLGVARNDAIQAHAWVRCGSVLVSGGSDISRFALISRFADGR